MFGILAQKKRCTKCGKKKSTKRFPKDKRSSDGLMSICSACNQEKTRIWRESNREKTREAARRWSKAHPDKVKQNIKRWLSENREWSREQKRQYRIAHPEIWRKSGQKYRKANPEKVSARTRQWQISNKDKLLKAGRDWSRRNPEKVRLKSQNRRALKKGNGGEITEQEWLNLLEKYEHRCLCCGRDDVKLTLDHVVPIKLGGPNMIDNAQPLCRSCNSKKGFQVIDYRP